MPSFHTSSGPPAAPAAACFLAIRKTADRIPSPLQQFDSYIAKRLVEVVAYFVNQRCFGKSGFTVFELERRGSGIQARVRQVCVADGDIHVVVIMLVIERLGLGRHLDFEDTDIFVA